MEISGVSSKAYTSAAASLEEEDELKETQEENATEEAKEYGVSTKEAEEKDTTQFSSSEYDEDDVEEKATNYLNTFDVAQFIKTYGPFTSTSEISAAMYAATSGMIKQQQDE